MPTLPSLVAPQVVARATYSATHVDVIKWKHFPLYWIFARGIHWSPVSSSHKGQWRGALVFSFICTWTDAWANNRNAGDLKRHRAHYNVTVMFNVEARTIRRYPAEDISTIFLDANILIQISLKFVLRGPVFVHTWLGNGQATSHFLTQSHICMYPGVWLTKKISIISGNGLALNRWQAITETVNWLI